MSKCYIYNGIKYNQKQLVELMEEEILNHPEKYPELSSQLLKANTLEEIVNKLLTIQREGNRKTKDTGWISVSDYIESKFSFSHAPQGIQILPIYNEPNRIVNSVKNELIRQQQESINVATPEQIWEDIVDQIKDEKLGTEFGTYFHDLVGKLFSDGKTSLKYRETRLDIAQKLETTSSETGKNLVTYLSENSGKTYTADLILTIIENRAIELFDSILTQFPGCKPFSELVMTSKDAKAPLDLAADFTYNGLGGRADLVLVDENGHIHIIDFKVATRKYNDWFAAKKYHTEYQLGMYRQILAANGIDGSKIHLYVLPIYLNKGKIDDLEIESIQDLLRSTDSGFAHLDWNHGSFTSNIRELLPVTISVAPSESSELVNAIEEDLSKMVTYDPIHKSYSKDELTKKIEPIKINGVVKYKFIDWLDNKVIIKNTLEEFTKDGGILDKFNLKLADLTKTQIKTIASDVLKQKGKAAGQNGFDFLQIKDKTSSLALLLSHTFGEYTHTVWKPLDIPALAEIGILAFENTETQVINFVTITDQNLDAVVDNNGQTTVLGNYVTNDEARQLSFEALDANCGNMELIKTLHAINVLSQKIPELQQKQIGSIEVLNIHLGLKRLADNELLELNYAFLTTKKGVKNNFIEGTLNFAEYWDRIMGYVSRCMREDSIDPETKSIITSIKMDPRSKAEKLRILKNAIALMKAKHAKYNWHNFKEERNFKPEDDNDMLFLVLNEAYLYYLDIPTNYSGEIQKWGIQFGEVIKLLTIPFISNQANNLKNGMKSSGILTGAQISSPSTIPSETLRALYQYYDIAFLKVRLEFLQLRKIIENLTRKYILDRQSQISRFLWNDTNDIWRELMVKEPDGKTLSKTLSLRNPYEDKTLTKELADFLKAILWEMNKYQLNLSPELRDLHYPTDAESIENHLTLDTNLSKAIANGSYFYLPLRKTGDFQRFKNIGRNGVTTYFEKVWDNIQNDYDPRNLHGSQNTALTKEFNKNSITMYNAYEGMNDQYRLEFIEKEGVDDFELDLDYLISDVAFLSIRKKHFEDVLLITDALATLLHFLQQNTGMDFNTEIEAMDDQSKVDTGQTLYDKETKDATALIGVAKKLNSLVVLSFRPLLLFKELTYGHLTNYSRAWALKHTGSAFSAKSVFEAEKVVWGQSGRKYINAISGNGDIADYTICEGINKLYGIANEDLNRTVDNSTLQRFGATHNFSRWMFLANSAPDYFNRLTLYIAKMIEDGCFEAHEFDANGLVVYNFKKDSRFSEIVKYGWNAKRTDAKFLEQKALFRAMALDFEREGHQLIHVDADGNETISDPPRAYTISQRNSLKEVADLAYGFYDHEAKSLIDHKYIGLIWKQFMTFWSAKTTLWFRGRGKNTSQGKFVLVETTDENGKKHKVYRHVEELPNGLLKVTYVTEENREANDEPLYTWQGEYVEGLAYSVMGTLHDIFHLDFKHLREDKLQLGNLKLALHDLLMGWILFSILRFIFSGGTDKMRDIHPTARIFLRAMLDVGPQSIASLSWEPGFVSTLTNVKKDMFSLFDDDPDFVDKMTKRISALSDWTQNIE